MSAPKYQCPVCEGYCRPKGKWIGGPITKPTNAKCKNCTMTYTFWPDGKIERAKA